MQLTEYRICLPFSVEEYKRAQLYMIARHCHQESEKGEGVEVIKYEPCEDPIHGTGHYTEKRLHLYNKLPYWMQGFIPNMFYIEEKSWNYFPYTVTEYSCSFLPKFQVTVQTRYLDDCGERENPHNLSEEEISQRVIDVVDIVNDPVPEHKYKESEDPKKVQILKTEPPRGPLKETWKNDLRQENKPIMCSYKIVKTKFEVWGLQTRVESYSQKAIRDILLLAHRQAFCWQDEWCDRSYEDIVEYERETYKLTNAKVLNQLDSTYTKTASNIPEQTVSSQHLKNDQKDL